VPRTQLLRLARGLQPLERVLADRLQHDEAVGADRLQQAQIDERREGVEIGLTDLLRSVERESAGEDAQAPEELLLFRGQQLVAPLDRRPQGALTLGGVPRAAGE
jgi:hypothetical protein